VNKNQLFWEKILGWFNTYSRSYPWREADDVYYVFVAEFLLQQTHVRKVEPVYHTITTRYATIEDLAIADSEEMKSYISPIGLKYRADRMISAATTIVHRYNGEVPNTYKELISLSGIGDYIANAVLCYGYGQNTVPIDTNVIRLFVRYFGLTSASSRPRTDKKLAQSIRHLFFVELNFRTVNLAVLDFAGIVCTASKPRCTECPLAGSCCKYQETLTQM